MRWEISHRADPASRVIADAHYNRQKIGATGFVPPGRCLVLRAQRRGKGRNRRALWVTSWPYAKYVRHAWAGAWVCSAFRNEGAGLASSLITEAVAATRWRWPDTPALGFVSFVNEAKVKPRERPGQCYLDAGWVYAEELGEEPRTQGGLLVVRLLPEMMPAPQAPGGVYTGDLFL